MKNIWWNPSLLLEFRNHIVSPISQFICVYIYIYMSISPCVLDFASIFAYSQHLTTITTFLDWADVDIHHWEDVDIHIIMVITSAENKNKYNIQLCFKRILKQHHTCNLGIWKNKLSLPSAWKYITAWDNYGAVYHQHQMVGDMFAFTLW